jgi:hypothetical protein
MIGRWRAVYGEIRVSPMRRILISLTLVILLLVSIGLGIAVAAWPQWRHWLD